MSARTDLADLVTAAAPANWDVRSYPTRLRTFDDPGKDVGIVIEQRTMQAGPFSDTPESLGIVVELVLWVVVDGSRGEAEDVTEDRLEAAAEQVVRILAQLPDDVWDGTATRDNYDVQKPCYQFTIRAAGALTQE